MVVRLKCRWSLRFSCRIVPRNRGEKERKMTSKNETIKDALKVLRVYPKAEASDGSGLVVLNNMAIADRIEAAHKREVAELRECLREAVTEVCNRLEKCGFKEPCVFKTCYVQKWRKALKGASND